MNVYKLTLTALLLTLGCETGTGPGTGAGGHSGGKSPRLVVLIDRSVGMQDGTHKACNNLAGIAQKLIASHRNRTTTLSVFLTGTKGQVGARLMEHITFNGMHSSGGIEASQKGLAEAEKKRQATVAGLVAKCQAQAKPVNYSPLYAGLRGVIKDLGQRCGAGTPCKVVFYTDLQEIAEPWMCTEIFGGKWYGKKDGCPRNPGRPAPKRSEDSDGNVVLQWQDAAKPKSVDASGIAITVCGLSESSDSGAAKMQPDALDRRDQMWKDLFPGANSFEILSSCSML